MISTVIYSNTVTNLRPSPNMSSSCHHSNMQLDFFHSCLVLEFSKVSAHWKPWKSSHFQLSSRQGCRNWGTQVAVELTVLAFCSWLRVWIYLFLWRPCNIVILCIRCQLTWGCAQMKSDSARASSMSFVLSSLRCESDFWVSSSSYARRKH